MDLAAYIRLETSTLRNLVDGSCSPAIAETVLAHCHRRICSLTQENTLGRLVTMIGSLPESQRMLAERILASLNPIAYAKDDYSETLSKILCILGTTTSVKPQDNRKYAETMPDTM